MGIHRIHPPGVHFARARHAHRRVVLFPVPAVRLRVSATSSTRTMARGKCKTKQASLQTAGLLPMLKKPAEAVGHYPMFSRTPCPTHSSTA